MPTVDFDSLPTDARVWVFAADTPLAQGGAHALLQEVDAFLAQWNAHGHPLRCACAWRDERFLAVGVDQSTAGASGCSIDGLFRALQRIQPALGASLLPAGRVFWRDAAGEIRTGDRAEFVRLAAAGTVTDATPVFDTAVTTAVQWREAFELPAERTWHGELVNSAASLNDSAASRDDSAASRDDSAASRDDSAASRHEMSEPASPA
jgi:hypothetical protein